MALTILQPWAACICHCGKRVENRTWPPPAAIVGQRIAIHAGRRFDMEGWVALGSNRDLVGPTGVMSICSWAALSSQRSPRGVVVATAIVERVVRTCDSPWFCGPFGWVLADVQPIVPVSCRGAQGLWTLTKAVDAAVMAQCVAATHGRMPPC